MNTLADRTRKFEDLIGHLLSGIKQEAVGKMRNAVLVGR